jgi:hypothetical protein
MKPKVLARANALTLGDKRYASTKVLSADYAHHCFYSVKGKTFKRPIKVNSTMAAAFFIACKRLEAKATARTAAAHLKLERLFCHIFEIYVSLRLALSQIEIFHIFERPFAGIAAR